MTFVNTGTLGAAPGKPDELVAFLPEHDESPTGAGCQAYEVGVNDDQPDTVFVVELWNTADAHRSSLGLPQVQDAIARARPLLDGTFGGHSFTVAGSPPGTDSAPAPGRLAKLPLVDYLMGTMPH